MESRVVGRRREPREIEAFVEGTSAGAVALVLDGEAGIGKTIWEEAVAFARAAGFRVLVARPAESEASPAYKAGVQALAKPGWLTSAQAVTLGNLADAL